MATIDEIRETLTYPNTYTPRVAEGRAVTLTRRPGAGVELALRPYLLCQDWDKRVVIHWTDNHGPHSLEVTRIMEDTPERFSFHANEPELIEYRLEPLTRELFDRELRGGYHRQGHVPDFADDAALSAWLLRR
jgi:hypothetical protein